MSAIPGFGQASFAGNFGSALGGIMPFAEGGIVTGPTVGLVGEAGPEAVIPLDRMGEMGGQQGGTLNARIGMDELIFQMDRQLKARGQNGLIG
jgi:phage-related minor tail protein